VPLVGTSDPHGILQSVRLLKLDVSLQWFVEACGEDGDLVWFREGVTIGQVREEGLHVVGDRPLQAKVIARKGGCCMMVGRSGGWPAP
jgi:hypothetical protein